MQFRVRDQPRIAAGELSVSFRRWRSPQARVGGRYRVGDGAVEVDEVRRVAPSQISSADAQAAGYANAEEVLASIERQRRRGASPDAPLYRVAFHYVGAHVDPRKQLAAEDALSEAELDDLLTRLARMDDRSARGAWTRQTLGAIAAQPGRRAGDLAAACGCETARYKADVRKLKALGLTISLEVGYQLSPRGEVALAALGRMGEQEGRE